MFQTEGTVMDKGVELVKQLIMCKGTPTNLVLLEHKVNKTGEKREAGRGPRHGASGKLD